MGLPTIPFASSFLCCKGTHCARKLRKRPWLLFKAVWHAWKNNFRPKFEKSFEKSAGFQPTLKHCFWTVFKAGPGLPQSSQTKVTQFLPPRLAFVSDTTTGGSMDTSNQFQHFWKWLVIPFFLESWEWMVQGLSSCLLPQAGLELRLSCSSDFTPRPNCLFLRRVTFMWVTLDGVVVYDRVLCVFRSKHISVSSNTGIWSWKPASLWILVLKGKISWRRK